MVRIVTNMMIIAIIAVCLGGSSDLAAARTITVGPGGGYDFGTIQPAINDANGGDTVIVAPGRYSENVTFDGNNIVLTSMNPEDPIIVAGTIIDANGLGTVVTFVGSEDANCVLAGFTITGGNAEDGGAGYGHGSKAVIRKCIIKNNHAEHGGGLCYCDGPISNCIITHNSAGRHGGGLVACDGPISNCIITHNSVVDYGGGLSYCDGPISNCTVTQNSSGNHGGGLYNCDGPISNCTITDNTAADGGGALRRCDGPISNCVIARNSAFWGAGLGSCNGVIRNCTVTDNLASEQSGAVGLCDGLITNCIIWANLPDQFDECAATITYSCVGAGATGIGNISDDPLFVNPDANDYHLRFDSPCINAGNPGFVAQANEVDIDGEQRILHGRVDMGADEYRGNMRPTAAAGPDQSASSIPSLVTLDGGGSFDLDGDDLNYNWSQIAGPEVQLSDANTAAPSFVPLQFGVYTFELTVNDGVYNSIPDAVNIGIGVGRIPVADAGRPRYATQGFVIYRGAGEIPTPVNDYVVLDGTASYDPDSSASLSYQWRQISGQPLDIVDANTPTPRVTGFVQGNAIQVCEFELVVNDGDYNSLPDTVGVIIVLASNASKMLLENSAFDPDKPTTVYFPGGGSPWSSGGWDDTEWQSRANVISFKEWYSDEDPEHYPNGDRSYARCADMIVAYLSSMAPDYRHQIQVMGGSAGGYRSPSVAINMNRHRDARYAANRLTFFDCVWYGNIDDLLSQFLASRVDAEPCWVENYVSTAISYFLRGALNVGFDVYDHGQPQGWYRETTNPELTPFNGGVVAGAYWSVFGPGKNLQLAHTPGAYRYMFKWYGPRTSGYMVLHEDCTVCARLPHPVTLVRYKDNADPNGLVLSCYESENAVGYQLLMGPDPYRVGDYNVITDTPHPPNSIVTWLPFEHTWWTVRAYDQYGSTIHADPIHIDSLGLVTPVENLTSECRYQHISDALHFAAEADEIVVRPGTYNENVDFQGKNLTLRSVDSEDPAVVAATIIDGGGRGPTVTFSSGEDQRCMLCGFTITGAASAEGDSGGILCARLYRSGPTISNCIITANSAPAVYCDTSNPTLISCSIAGNEGAGVKLWSRCSPTIINCAITGNLGRGVFGGDPVISNCTIVGNRAEGVASYGPTISNSIVWANSLQQIVDYRGTGSVTHTNVQGGSPGAGNIDADPCFAEPGYWGDVNDPNVHVGPNHPNAVWLDGDYHLKSESGRWDPPSQSWVLDDVTSRCIDKGDWDSPVGDEPYPNGGRINMGAYGGTVEASKSLTCRHASACAGQALGDATCDGSVDLADLFALKASFGLSKGQAGYNCCADFTHDDKVDAGDLFALKAGFGSSDHTPATGAQDCPP